MRFKAVENTNYAIELGKQMHFSLVGVQGADITDGQRTLTLGLVWQLMRRDISETLSALAQRLGKREITDAEMVKWANEQSKKGGRNSSIRSFKDQAIGSGVFLLDVLNGMKSSYVDYDLVTSGRNDEEAYANAKLAISIARKMGATIWLVPEDICQVRSRLVVTFIGEQPSSHLFSSAMRHRLLTKEYQAPLWLLMRKCSLFSRAFSACLRCVFLGSRFERKSSNSNTEAEACFFYFCIGSETFTEQAPATDHVKQPASNDPALPSLTSPREQSSRTTHNSQLRKLPMQLTPWPHPSIQSNPIQPPLRTSHLTLSLENGALSTPLMGVTSSVFGSAAWGPGERLISVAGIIWPSTRENVYILLRMDLDFAVNGWIRFLLFTD